MAEEETTLTVSVKEIRFSNGNQAVLIAPPADAAPADILKALEIEQPGALIVVVGGAATLDQAMAADEALASHLTQLFSRGIACAAVEIGATVIDGGTHSGVMKLMGQGIADRERKAPLIGVAPAGKVTYPGGPEEGSIENGAPLDPNHSHFVLAPSDEWGGESDTLFDLAEEVGKEIPVITVLGGGNLEGVAKDEVLRSVRQGWPVVVLQGSGPLPDGIAAWWQKRKKNKAIFIPDPVLAEIVADGDIHLFPIDDSVEVLEREITSLLGVNIVKLAWERFALYDCNAVRQQKKFQGIRWWILAVGLFSTFLALVQTQLRVLDPLIGSYPWLDTTLHYAVVILPIVTSTLIAGANRFKPGSKWILLRASAEAIKREIFRYRAKASIYNDKNTRRTSRESKLARAVKSISSNLMQTEVNVSALRPYTGPIPPLYAAAAADDGLSFLVPNRYIAFRVDDQLNYFLSKTNKLEKQLKRYQWIILIAGGLGTVLAALGLELWVAMTTSLAAALTTYLEYQQVENSLTQYNQVATELANTRDWWVALSEVEQVDQDKVDKLVEDTEEALKKEQAGWIQQMQDILADMYAKEQEQQPPGTEGKK
jgi:hypothetical protein